MPNTKFSWRALREHLRKYFLIYLLGIALCLFGTGMLWTMTQPRLKNEEVVTVCLTANYSDPEPLETVAQHMLEQTQSYDSTLKSVEFESLLYADELYTSPMLLTTRMAVGECDAFLASQSAMDALVGSRGIVPLDDAVAGGWLSEYGLEPYYVTWEDEDTGESVTFLAGLRLDGVNALREMGAFDNDGAFLCVATNGGNVETTMKALETMMSDLTEANHAGTKAA